MQYEENTDATLPGPSALRPTASGTAAALEAATIWAHATEAEASMETVDNALFNLQQVLSHAACIVQAVLFRM